MPIRPIELKNPLPDLELNPDRRELSARQATGKGITTTQICKKCSIYGQEYEQKRNLDWSGTWQSAKVAGSMATKAITPQG